MERGLDYYLGFSLGDGAARDGEALGLRGRTRALVRGLRWWVLAVVVEVLGMEGLGSIELRTGLGCYCVVGVFLVWEGWLVVLGWLWWVLDVVMLLLILLLKLLGLLLFRADCTGKGVMSFLLRIVFSRVCLVLFAVMPVEQVAAYDYLETAEDHGCEVNWYRVGYAS